MDSVLTEHRPLVNADCGNMNPGMETDGKISNLMGFRYYENGDYANAIGCYQKAIALSPEYPIPHNNLGVVYLKSSNLELARECFSKAIVLDPKYIKAICNLAVVTYKMGDLEAAKELYHKARRVDGNYVKVRIENYRNRNP